MMATQSYENHGHTRLLNCCISVQCVQDSVDCVVSRNPAEVLGVDNPRLPLFETVELVQGEMADVNANTFPYKIDDQ